MPSKDSLCFLTPNNTGPTATQRDLDELVYQIKEKLRVKATAPSHTSCSEKTRLRASPYGIPSRGSKCGCCDSRRCMHRVYTTSTTHHHNATHLHNTIMIGSGFHNTASSMPHTDDPYEALQDLLRDGDLIKEAVRRLHINVFRPKDKSSLVFYDSDEERTPYPFNVDV
uniref:GSK-3-binding protein-like n=1 Tax=Hirondellea gigas TaxID=1518452 RepID=A0A2P2I6P1_9CRUS